MGQVLVAHAAGDADVAARVAAALRAEKLDAASFAGAPNTKADKARFDGATGLVLVWSRHTTGDAGLRREALAAAARGALALARVDGAAAPAPLRAVLSVAVPRAGGGVGPSRLARRLAARLSPSSQPRTKPMTADPTPNVSNWKGALLLAVLLGGVAWSAAWVSLGASPAPLLMSLLKG
jgi:hypothetical protein